MIRKEGFVKRDRRHGDVCRDPKVVDTRTRHVGGSGRYMAEALVLEPFLQWRKGRAVPANVEITHNNQWHREYMRKNVLEALKDGIQCGSYVEVYGA